MDSKIFFSLAPLRHTRRIFFSVAIMSAITSAFFFGFAMLAEPAQAAKKADDDISGKNDMLFEGKETDDVKIRKGVTITGTSPAKAVINGDVSMENGSVLKNVTINASTIGVTVEKGASVVLENVTIKGASDAGIITRGGGGTLTVRNSRISQNRKGFYILPGKVVQLIGNQITKNKEEGLDIRQGVSGTISGNTFSQNSEGGAEIIIGGASLTITGNIFSGNGSSGLALQSYSSATGKSSVLRNTFSGNGNFGIDCKNTLGGGDMSTFRSSISVRENNFRSNKKGGINPICRLFNIERIEEEERENDGEEADTKPEIPLEEEPSRLKEVRLEELAGEVASVEREIREPRMFWQSFEHFALGTDTWHFATERQNIERLLRQLDAFKVVSADERLPEINALFPEKIETLEETLAELSEILTTQEAWVPFPSR